MNFIWQLTKITIGGVLTFWLVSMTILPFWGADPANAHEWEESWGCWRGPGEIPPEIRAIAKNIIVDTTGPPGLTLYRIGDQGMMRWSFNNKSYKTDYYKTDDNVAMSWGDFVLLRNAKGEYEHWTGDCLENEEETCYVNWICKPQ